MIRFLDIANHTLFWYYLASNFSYLMMLMIAQDQCGPSA